MDNRKFAGILIISLFGILFFISITLFILSVFAEMFNLAAVSGLVALALYIVRKKVSVFIRKKIIRR